MSDDPEPPGDSPDGTVPGPRRDPGRDPSASTAELVKRLADRLAAAHDESGPGCAVELAVGRRPGVAAALAARGVDVVATDVRERAVPEDVTFVRDDVTDPDEAVYAGAALVYARNLPAELQRPARDLAAAVDAPLYFTTLGAEEPVLPVDRESLAGGAVRETLYCASDAPG